jgi:hypothetical protein
VWHLVFLAFFAFSILRFVVYLGERQIYRGERKADFSRRNLPMARTTHTLTSVGANAQSRRGNSDLVDIPGTLQGGTEKAYRFYDGKITVWLPKSQCEWDEESHVMTMPEWLAIEKELV